MTPKTWRPMAPRVMAFALVIALGAACAATWISLGAEVQAKFSIFELLTLAFLGALIVACMHALGRSRVTATDETLIVVNGYSTHVIEWREIRSLGMPKGSPWVRLTVADDEEIPVLGIQSADGAAGRAAAQELREIAIERYAATVPSAGEADA